MNEDEILNLIFMLIITGIIIYGLLGLIINGIQWLINRLLTDKIIQGAAIFSIIYILLRLSND